MGLYGFVDLLKSLPSGQEFLGFLLSFLHNHLPFSSTPGSRLPLETKEEDLGNDGSPFSSE